MDLWGRDEELRDVLARLATRRLVTLTGPGGIGKTALARVALARAKGGFALGGARVDLTVVDDPERVPGTIAAQLGFRSFEALVDSPTEQPVLLVDNCEHVLGAAADAVRASPTYRRTHRAAGAGQCPQSRSDWSGAQAH